MLFWTNSVWSDCVTAQNKENENGKLLLSPQFPQGIFSHCERDDIVWLFWRWKLCSCAIHPLLYHSIPSLLYYSFTPEPFIFSCTIQFHRSCTSLDALCSRGPAQVVTFQLGSNSGLLLRIPQLCPWTLGRTRPSVQDIAVSCVGTQKALYPWWTLQPREDRVIVLHLVFQRYRTGANRCLLT